MLALPRLAHRLATVSRLIFHAADGIPHLLSIDAEAGHPKTVANETASAMLAR